MKRLLLVVLFLLSANCAYAGSFAVDLNQDGDLDIFSDVSNNELEERGFGVVALLDTTNFYELAAGVIEAQTVAYEYFDTTDGDGNTQTSGFDDDFVLTYVLEGEGTYVRTGTGTDTEDVFTFTEATIDFYLSDASLGSDLGYILNDISTTSVASFEMTQGSGNLEFDNGSTTDGVNIFAVADSGIDLGVFSFVESSLDPVSNWTVLDDWAYYNDFANLLVQIIIDTQNQLAGDLVGTDARTQFFSSSEWTATGYDTPLETLVVQTNGKLASSVVPEPTTFMLLGFSLLGLAGISRKKA